MQLWQSLPLQIKNIPFAPGKYGSKGEKGNYSFFESSAFFDALVLAWFLLLMYLLI
jgi:hypothetical protein